LLPSLPSFHAIILLHLLHVTMFESFCAKYSHTFDRLAFGIFSVKRLMASFVCACLLFTVISAPVPIQPVPTRTEMQRRFRCFISVLEPIENGRSADSVRHMYNGPRHQYTRV